MKKRLSDIQFEFVVDVVRLLSYCIQKGIKVTFGEAWRPDEMQEIYYKTGRSRIKERGPHGNRLAIDLNFFIDDRYTTDKDELQKIGDYWESLSELNKWGGNFPKWFKGSAFIDTPHFERSI